MKKLKVFTSFQGAVWTMGKPKYVIRVLVMGSIQSSTKEVIDLILGNTVQFYQGQVRVGSVLWNNVEIVIAEAPVMSFNSSEGAKQTSGQLINALKCLSPGPNSFLCVLNSSRKTEIRLFEETFALLGKNAIKHAVLLPWYSHERNKHTVVRQHLTEIKFLDGQCYHLRKQQKNKWSPEEIRSRIQHQFVILRQSHLPENELCPDPFVIQTLIGLNKVEENLKDVGTSLEIKAFRPHNFAVKIIKKRTETAAIKIADLRDKLDGRLYFVRIFILIKTTL